MHRKNISCKCRKHIMSVDTVCQQIHTSWGTDTSICLNLRRERPRPKQNWRRSCSLSEMALCRKKMLLAVLKHLNILPSPFSYTFKTRLPYRTVRAELNALKYKQFSPQEQPQTNTCLVALSLQTSLKLPTMGTSSLPGKGYWSLLWQFKLQKDTPLYTIITTWHIKALRKSWCSAS